MTNRLHTSEEVLKIVRRVAGEVLGPDELATNTILGGVATRLARDTLPSAEPNHEAPDYSKPPNYAVRAIRARTSRELADLIAEAANRLSKSIADYHKPTRFEEGSRKVVLTPTIFAEGSTVSQNPIGSLHIEVANNGEIIDTDTVASLWLADGEDSPSDPTERFSSEGTHLDQMLIIRKRRVRDPVSGEIQDAFYVEVSADWRGKGFSGGDGKVYEAKYGKPIGAEGAIIKAKLFWALDMAIRYYEEVYITGNHGLTYADYRNAGCLNGDLLPDWEKAQACIKLPSDKTKKRSDDEAVLIPRDHETTFLTMDPDSKAEVERYIADHRRYLAAQRKVAIVS